MILLEFMHACNNLIDGNQGEEGNFESSINRLLSIIDITYPFFQGDCLDRSCSDHGTCAEGNCYCDLGWSGETCSERNRMIEPCLPTCSHHGSYDTLLGHCRLVDLSELEKHLSEMEMFQYQYFNHRDAFVAALYLRLLLSSGRHFHSTF